MVKEPSKDPFTQFTQLGEALVAVWGPAVIALTEYFERFARMRALIVRVADAGKAGKSLHLSVDDVKDLCVLLYTLQDGKK